MRADGTTDYLIPKSQRHCRTGHDNRIQFRIVKSGSKYTYVGHNGYFSGLERFKDMFTFFFRCFSRNDGCSGNRPGKTFCFLQKTGENQYTFSFYTALGIHKPLHNAHQKPVEVDTLILFYYRLVRVVGSGSVYLQIKFVPSQRIHRIIVQLRKIPHIQ